MNIRKTTRISKWQASLLALVMTVLMAGRIALANGLPAPLSMMRCWRAHRSPGSWSLMKILTD